MSTKGTILSNSNNTIYAYQETSEPVEKWGKFYGWNIYLQIREAEFYIDQSYIKVKILSPYDLEQGYIPKEFKMPLTSLNYIEQDDYGLELAIKGDSYGADLMNKGKEFWDKWGLNNE